MYAGAEAVPSLAGVGIQENLSAVSSSHVINLLNLLIWGRVGTL